MCASHSCKLTMRVQVCPLTHKHLPKVAEGSKHAIEKTVVCIAYAADSTSGTKSTSVLVSGDAKKTWYDVDTGMRNGLVVAGTSSIIAATIAVRCTFFHFCVMSARQDFVRTGIISVTIAFAD